jgi:hypothetical protein
LLDAGIDLANCIGVGDADRPEDETEILQIGLARHLAVAVQIEEAAIDFLDARPPARQDHGDAAPHGSLANLERALASDEADLTDLDARHVGDGVERPGCSLEWYAERAPS